MYNINDIRNDIHHINKLELHCTLYASPTSICNGFTATGLIPFDPQLVLDKLNGNNTYLLHR